MVTVRPPAVAGLFYPADSQQLAEHIEQLLSAAQSHKLIPKALIVPHAGYIAKSVNNDLKSILIVLPNTNGSKPKHCIDNKTKNHRYILQILNLTNHY